MHAIEQYKFLALPKTEKAVLEDVSNGKKAPTRTVMSSESFWTQRSILSFLLWGMVRKRIKYRIYLSQSFFFFILLSFSLVSASFLAQHKTALPYLLWMLQGRNAGIKSVWRLIQTMAAI